MNSILNILIGIPQDNINLMFETFLKTEGKHIVCGGWTSYQLSNYLKKDVKVSLNYYDNDIPPIGKIEGIDLVTEGTITLKKVSTYLKDYFYNNTINTINKKDGASLLFNEMINSIKINFYVGKSINIYHKDILPNKLVIIEEIISLLDKLNKSLEIKYY